MEINTKKSIESLVEDLMNNNIWDKMLAIYPTIGSSENFNLKVEQKWIRKIKINKLWINKRDTIEHT